MNIRLHIERLVLLGMPIGSDQTEALRTAAESELIRLLSQDGIGPELAAGVTLPNLIGGTLPLASGVTAATIGSGLGAAVHLALGGSHSPAEPPGDVLGRQTT